LGADQAKAVAAGPLFEVLPHQGGRTAVDVNQFRGPAMLQHADQRFRRKTESLTGDDGDRDLGFRHVLLPVCSRSGGVQPGERGASRLRGTTRVYRRWRPGAWSETVLNSPTCGATCC